ILRGDGDGTFQLGATIPVASVPMLRIADLNADGKPDLVVSTFYSKLFILIGRGDGTFALTTLDATAVEGSYIPSVGDLDGDGRLDVVLARRYLGVDLFFGRGDGSFAPAKNLAVGMVEDTALADLDGNGTMDLLLASNGLSVLPGRGDG